jgi:hypothetical protein
MELASRRFWRLEFECGPYKFWKTCATLIWEFSESPYEIPVRSTCIFIKTWIHFFWTLSCRIYLTCTLTGVSKLCPKTSTQLNAVFMCSMSKPVNFAVTHRMLRTVRLVVHVTHREKRNTKFSPEVLIAFGQNKCRYKNLLRYNRHGSCPNNTSTALYSNLIK